MKFYQISHKASRLKLKIKIHMYYNNYYNATAKC